MSYLEHKEDTCRNADDVRAAARRVWEIRTASRPKRETKVWLHELVRRAEVSPPPIILDDPPPVRENLSGPINEILARGVSVKDIQNAVAKEFKISFLELLSHRRNVSISLPRHVSMLLCKLLTLRSYPDIGRRHGGRDHTTVLHGVKKYQWLGEKLCAELADTDHLSQWAKRAHELIEIGCPND